VEGSCEHGNEPSGSHNWRLIRARHHEVSLILTNFISVNVECPIYKSENTAVEIRHAEHMAPLSAKLALTSLTSVGRSVGIVLSQTQATEFKFNVECGTVVALTSVVCLLFLSDVEVLCACVLVKSGLENRDYVRRGSAALTMRRSSIRISWH
jgi:hypothetical protein